MNQEFDNTITMALGALIAVALFLIRGYIMAIVRVINYRRLMRGESNGYCG